MPRRPSIEPRRTSDPDYPWLVNLPPSLGAKGLRERRYFKSQKEATVFATQQRIRLENYGTASTMLPAGKVEEAAAAFERLRGVGTLTQAVAHYVEWHTRRTSSVTFGALMQKFAAAKAGRSDPYKAQIRQTTSAFSALAGKSAIDVTDQDVDGIASASPPSRRNAFLRVIRAAYNLGIRKRWCHCQNPILQLDFAEEDPKTTLLTNEQVSALLTAAVATDLPLLPYLLFTIFAGVRPDEASWLRWDDVSFEEKFVRVTEETSKTNARRIITMEKLLVRWLHFYRAGGGSTEGRIAPSTNFRKRMRKVREAAGIMEWPQDAPRRTYASNHLAFFNDEVTLCRYMGHTTTTMLRQRYDKVVTKKNAAAFWNIEPPRLPGDAKRARSRRSDAPPKPARA